MKITRESLKWPQLDAAFKYIYDNDLYHKMAHNAILEFGTGQGNSTKKICDHLKENDMEDVWVFTFDSFDGLPYEDGNVELFSKYIKGAYKLNKQNPVNYIQTKVDYNRLLVIHSDFETLYNYELPKLWGDNFTDVIHPLLIHIDCDLYNSTRAALAWLKRHNLIINNLLIAYDEYQSTDNPYGGGESLAHFQFFYGLKNKYNAEEVWHNLYRDKDTGQKIRQSVFEVTTV